MKYNLTRVESEVVRRLCEKFHIDFLSANIFARRAITRSQDIKYYLESGLNYLHSPFLFKDMEEAVERINTALEEGEKVAIFGDRDADGVTSTAILSLELEAMGFTLYTHLPENDDPYGLTAQAVEKIIAEGVTLLITVDCGISCIDEVDALNAAGVDVIITDHHIAGERLPNALAIIDPKVAECGYPFEHLAGCGVASKLIWALRFSATPLYRSPVILLHAEPGPGENTTTIVQAIELENLVITDQVIEELPNGSVDFEGSRLVRLLTRNEPIMVLDKDLELRQLRLAFGPSVDISLVELRNELEKTIPRVRGKNLFALAAESRAALYADGHAEVETLLSLFSSCYIYKYPSLSKDFFTLLDLVAIGTIADLMPLVDENRILVRHGLKMLERGTRESLIPLLSAQGLAEQPIASQDIAWYISPVINSAGRLGCPTVALELLKSSDLAATHELTQKLLSLNKERQKMGDEAWQASQKSARESLESFGSKFVLLDTGSPRGLTGILANRALKEFSTAEGVIVLSCEEDGHISGSMRAKKGLNCRGFLSKFSSVFSDFGGHAGAGGFSLEADKKEEFKKALDEEVLKMDISEEGEELTVDAMISEGDMSVNLMRIVELFEPYGEANSPLVFLVNGAKVTDRIVLGDASKGNIRLSLQIGRNIWSALWWGGGNDKGKEIKVGDSIRLIFRLGRNYYRGTANVQLTILDAEKVE